MALEIRSDDEVEDITDEKPITKTRKVKPLDGRALGQEKFYYRHDEIRIKREILADDYFFGEVER